ncbi:hypothetical protein IGI04_018675, partial [Brassica rapa subsp. trilocularis]
NLHKSYLLAFYTADEGQAQISALHLIEAREARKTPHVRTPEIFKLQIFFRLGSQGFEHTEVDPAAVFVCFLQASSEECVCKLALA